MQNTPKFSELQLPPILVTALESMGFENPTPIQAKSIPPALAGRDILAIAPTGTGKTGAFGIPAMAGLYNNPGKQVLVLAPTRELAAQIHKFLAKLGKTMDFACTLIVGGESNYRQRAEVKAGVDFLIATPGRFMDHIERGIPLEKISVLVLDEVDRMLDMGFAPQVEQIVKSLPPERQTFLFSATLPPEIVKLAHRYLKNPEQVNVTGDAQAAPKISEEQIDTNDVEKPRLLVDKVTELPGKILIFANTQGRVEQAARRLEHAGHPAAYMHGGRTHGERKKALEAFRNGVVRVLVATDIAARGIDVSDIETVINYDYPATKEDYLHRIGRTGRIGKEGRAITFMDPKRRPRGHRPAGRPPAASAPRSAPSAKKPFRSDEPKKPFVARSQDFRKPFAARKSEDRRPARPMGERDARRTGPRRPPFKGGRPAFRTERPAFDGKVRTGEQRGPRPRPPGKGSPNAHVFRAGEEREYSPQQGRRHASRGFAPPPKKQRTPKPWVRGTGGSPRRKGPKPADTDARPQ